MAIASYRLLVKALGVLCAVVFLAGPGRAQTAETIAEERFREGTSHYVGRRYDEARAAFMQAYALDPKPEYLLFLGHAELRTGQAALAATRLARFLRDNPGASEEDRQEADIDLAAARAKVTEVTIRAPDGMEVSVDERSLGKAPFDHPEYITPGLRTLRGRLDGQTRERSVDAKPGGTLLVDFDAPSPVGASPPVAADASSEVGTDATFDAPEAADDRKPFGRWFRETPLAWVGAGLAGGGLILGTTFAITSKTHFDKANRIGDFLRSVGSAPCNPPADADTARACRDFEGSRDAGNTQRTLAIVGFSVAGAAAIGTVVYYFIDPNARRASEGRVSFRPDIGRASATLNLSGAF